MTRAHGGWNAVWPVCLSLLLATGEARATQYYVATSGSDGSSGTTETQAFATLQRAANVTQPGDTVYVMAGTYSNAQPGYTAVVRITRSGTPDKPIRYLAYPGHRPLIW